MGECVKVIDPRVEELLVKYFQNKEISKERNQENKQIFEDLSLFFDQLGEEELTVPLPDGTDAVLTKQASVKEVLDKSSLAQALLVDKDEIKTPFDYSMFTAQGKLTPDMISDHTTTETIVKVKLQKRKPRKRRKRS